MATGKGRAKCFGPNSARPASNAKCTRITTDQGELTKQDRTTNDQRTLSQSDESYCFWIDSVATDTSLLVNRDPSNILLFKVIDMSPPAGPDGKCREI
jgi:hypothetical protein